MTESATGKDDLLRLQTRQRLDYNMTVRATGKDGLLRIQMRQRLDCSMTEIATGISEHWEHLASRSSHLFNNAVFKRRWRNSMRIWLHWRSQCVPPVQKRSLVCNFILALLSVHTVAGTTVHRNCTPMAITWILAPSHAGN